MRTLGIGALVISALPALASADGVITKDLQRDTLDQEGACQQVDLGDGRDGVACPAMVIYVDEQAAQQVKQPEVKRLQALALTQNPQGQLSWYALDSLKEAAVSNAPWTKPSKQSEATLPSSEMVW